jgi:hypothetical protein
MQDTFYYYDKNKNIDIENSITNSLINNNEERNNSYKMSCISIFVIVVIVIVLGFLSYIIYLCANK